MEGKRNLRQRPSRGFSLVAAALAAVWIGGGFFATLAGIAQGRWVPPVCGLFAVWYGLVWVRAARQGRRLRWPDGLLPWRRPGR